MEASGELTLLYKIIERAVLDCQGSQCGVKPIQHIKRQARDWLFRWSAEDERDPLTFPWVCGLLEIDPFQTSKRIKSLLCQSNKFLQTSLSHAALKAVVLGESSSAARFLDPDGNTQATAVRYQRHVSGRW